MKLRNEIEPKIIEAERIFPKVLDLIREYDDAYDNEDEEQQEKIFATLSTLTGKDISEDDLFEHWEGDSDEITAFQFSLAAPLTLSSPLSQEELLEIIRRIRDSKHEKFQDIGNNVPFSKDMLWWVLQDYYSGLLEMNLKLPKKFSIHSLFNRQKVNGKYIEYTSEEILEKILSVVK